MKYCNCNQCKKMKRKGLILGAVDQSHWNPNGLHVSAYVPYFKFQKGKDKEMQAPVVEEWE